MTSASQISEAAEAFGVKLAAHPECRADLREAAALGGTPHPHAAFYLGRFPDPDEAASRVAAPPPTRSPEARLLAYLQHAAQPLELRNPITAVRGLGKGTGTLPAAFGIRLNAEAGFAPQGCRPLREMLRDGIPDPETSGLFPEMREDIEATLDLTPSWLKLALPDMQGPFSIAHMILGDDAFIAPLAKPDEWQAFMTLLTAFFIAAHETVTRWIGPDRLDTHPRRYHRITECSVNMVSQDFYREHVLPYDLQIIDYYGDVAIHPCSGPHVFHVTLACLPNIVCTEAGRMINPMTAGSITVPEALDAIGDRPIMLSIGEELPPGEEETTMRRLFDLAAKNPRVILGGFTGLNWKRADEPAMCDLHQRMNDYYARLVRDSAAHGVSAP